MLQSPCLSRFPSISPQTFPCYSSHFLVLFRLAGTAGCAVRSERGRRSGLCACGCVFWGAAGQCLCASFSAGRCVAFCCSALRPHRRPQSSSSRFTLSSAASTWGEGPGAESRDRRERFRAGPPDCSMLAAALRSRLARWFEGPPWLPPDAKLERIFSTRYL